MGLCHAAPSRNALAENTASSVRKVLFSHQLQVLSSHQQKGLNLLWCWGHSPGIWTAEPVLPNTTSDTEERRRSRCFIGAWVSPVRGYSEGGLAPLVSADSGPTAPGCCPSGAHPGSPCSGQTPGVNLSAWAGLTEEHRRVWVPAHSAKRESEAAVLFNELKQSQIGFLCVFGNSYK